MRYVLSGKTADQVEQKLGEHGGNRFGHAGTNAAQQTAMVYCDELFGVIDGCFTYLANVKVCYVQESSFRWEDIGDCYLCNPNVGEELDEGHIYLAVRYGLFHGKPLFAGECCPFGSGISMGEGNELCVLTAAPDSIDCTEAGFMVNNKCFTGHVTINDIDFPVTFTLTGSEE